jgi:hypothetical protein
VPGDASLDVSLCPNSINQEIADLRQQLQLMKKQTVTVLDQSRKSSDREHAALHQAQEALELKETATANATRSAQCESYMLDLMTDSSQDMTGMLLLSFYFLDIFLYPSLWYIYFSLTLLVGSFLDAAAEEQRVNSRVEFFLRLAKMNDIEFWANEDRTRRIVQFQDQAAQLREFRDFFGSTLAMVYNAMFPQNPQPENLTELR